MGEHTPTLTEEIMPEEYEKKSTWIKILFVAIFGVVFYITQFILFAVVVGQCLFSLFTGKPNEQLLKLGQNLSQYVHEILAFVTFNSDKRPFPFDDFPAGDKIIESEEKSD